MLILHGTNHVASRKALTELKDKARGEEVEIINLTGKGLILGLLKQALESASFFGGERLVVIEGLFSLPKSKTKESLLDYLKDEDLKTDLIIWEGKQIDGRVLRSFSKKANVQLFKISPMIFKFLDSLAPKNPRLILNFLHQTLKTDPPELVFFMLARRSRELIVAKDLGKKGLVKYAPWQRARLLGQAEKFSLPQLLNFHRQLLKIDWEQKTGQAVLPLKSRLDLLILDIG